MKIIKTGIGQEAFAASDQVAAGAGAQLFPVRMAVNPV